PILPSNWMRGLGLYLIALGGGKALLAACASASCRLCETEEGQRRKHGRAGAAQAAAAAGWLGGRQAEDVADVGDAIVIDIRADAVGGFERVANEIGVAIGQSKTRSENLVIRADGAAERVVGWPDGDPIAEAVGGDARQDVIAAVEGGVGVERLGV